MQGKCVPINILFRIDDDSMWDDIGKHLLHFYGIARSLAVISHPPSSVFPGGIRTSTLNHTSTVIHRRNQWRLKGRCKKSISLRVGHVISTPRLKVNPLLGLISRNSSETIIHLLSSHNLCTNNVVFSLHYSRDGLELEYPSNI